MNTLPVLPALRVTPISRLTQGGKWRAEGPRAWGEPVLYWITRGQGRVTVEDTLQGYGPHNAIFLPAGTMHDVEATMPLFGSAVFFGRESGLRLPLEFVHLRIREVQAQTELNNLIDQLVRELDGLRPAKDRAARAWLELIGVWLERHAEGVATGTDAPRPDAARKLTARYTALLEREFRSGRGVADFAHDLGVTPTQLSRVCRVASGRTAHDILQDRLIDEARRLLSETSMPVGQVARELGFSSPAYFTRAFHQHTGKSPAAFRRFV